MYSEPIEIFLSISLSNQSYKSFDQRYQIMEIFTSIETMVKGTVVNRAFPSLHEESLKITLTAPLISQKIKNVTLGLGNRDDISLKFTV